MWPILLAWFVAGTPLSASARGPLLVSAAVSLTEALTECGEAFTAATGIKVRFNFGPSNALARQIVQGAPVDVFVSADETQMDFAVHERAVVPATVTPIATNRLVVIVPGTNRQKWRDATPLAGAAIHRVATGDPAAVPAGVYAREWLTRIGLWERVAPKVVPAASVRGALSAVRTGAVDAGIVYRTDVRSGHDTTVVYEVSGSEAPRIVYPAGVATRSPRAPEARAFIHFLLGAAAQRILEKSDFGLASVSTRQ